MERIAPQVPILILLYGFPGSGKTYFSRQFCQEVQAAHLEEDRIRHELFENPKFTKQENYAVARIMHHMAGEFLNAGVSVVFDTNATRVAQRRAMREMAHKNKAACLTIWFQLDPDTAFLRNMKRDRRKLDDRFAPTYEPDQFKEVAAHMQHPEPNENYLVVSGKHTFPSQFSGTIKKMVDMDIVKQSVVMHKMVKPELVNLIAAHKPGREDSENGRHTIMLQ